MAGKLTPQANVLVATKTYILLASNNSSTIILSLYMRPAWWIPIPKANVFFKFESSTLDIIAELSSKFIFKNGDFI